MIKRWKPKYSRKTNTVQMASQKWNPRHYKKRLQLKHTKIIEKMVVKPPFTSKETISILSEISALCEVHINKIMEIKILCQNLKRLFLIEKATWIDSFTKEKKSQRRVWTIRNGLKAHAMCRRDWKSWIKEYSHCIKCK